MCDCISDMSKVLADHNGEIVLNLFDPTYVFIAVEKKVSKLRKKPPYLAATYCPFCGEKYPKRETVAYRKQDDGEGNG